MACSCSSIPPPKLFFSSPSPPTQSISIFLLPRKLFPFGIYALQSSNQLHAEEEQQLPEESPHNRLNSTDKKKRKKKLRPSFYDQTIDRWSARISSQRSRFPWQQELIKEKNQFPSHTETFVENFADIAKHGGGTVNERLNLIVDKLGGASDNVEFNCIDEQRADSDVLVVDDGDYAATKSFGRNAAPWLQGKKSNGNYFGLSDNNDNAKKVGDYKLEKLTNFNNIKELNSTKMEKTQGRAIEHKHAEFHESENITVSSMVDELKSSLENNTVGDSNNGNMISSRVKFPWDRDKSDDEMRVRKRSNTELAERSIPELELKRLRNVALRMKERMKVGPAGVTQALVESIHKNWRESEVVKLRFEGPLSLNMKRAHEILEMKTGGLVIWRSGSLIVLYRGMTYELPCVRSYNNLASTTSTLKNPPVSDSTSHVVGTLVKDPVTGAKTSTRDTRSPNSSEVSEDISEIDDLLDQLGPRFIDWSGRNPLPVDADLLPGVIPGYKPPYRFLPYKTKSSLRDREMTYLRNLARSMPPHFALGRNRQHQGLANAMVKLWEKSAIAKIAIKRGVPNTCNDRMSEEIKKLTGGVLLSRNKDFIVFYRGNDFLTPSIREALVEKQKQATFKQDEEEIARLQASAIISNTKSAKGPLVAGTLAETLQANTSWGNLPNDEDREKMRKDLAFTKHASLVRFFERKLALARAKFRKAEKALAKVQESLHPAELPTDLETVTDEERFLFRKIGLKMKSFLVLGRRGVFDGTIQNMHLSWKHRELVKIYVNRKSFPQVKHIAISLEAESGGVLISLDKTTKGYAIIIYRGKNYHRPQTLKPNTLLTRRQALARAIELQRREALNHHIADLQKKIDLMKSQLEQMEAGKDMNREDLGIKVDDFLSDDDVEDEGEEAYLKTYCSDNEDDEDDQ